MEIDDSPRKEAKVSTPARLPARDDDVDADASLERKRPRLSDDERSPPNGNYDPASEATPPSSPHIELVTQDLPKSPDSVIFAESTTIMTGVVETFPFIDKDLPTPEQAAAEFTRALRGTTNVSAGTICCFADWLEQTVPFLEKDEHVVDHPDFWNHIAQSVTALLDRKFLGRDLARDQDAANRVLRTIFTSYAALTAGLIALEIRELERAVARRDSVNDDPVIKHKLLFAGSLSTLADCLREDSQFFVAAKQDLDGFDQRRLQEDIRSTFLHATGDLDDVVKLFEVTSTNKSQLDGSFTLLLGCLHILQLLQADPRQFLVVLTSDISLKYVKLFTHAWEVLLPDIIKSSPADAPRGLCERMVYLLQALLPNLCLCRPDFVGDMFYMLFQNMVMTTNAKAEDGGMVITTASLQTECYHLASDIILQAFNIHLAASLLDSSVVHMQALGVDISNRACEFVWALARRRPDDGMVVSAGRAVIPRILISFIRDQGLLKKIFGPDAHADAMRRCANTMLFFPFHDEYTDAETKLIWDRGLSQSKQTDIAEACSTVLTTLITHDVSLPLVRHVLSRYATMRMPMNKSHIILLNATTNRLQRCKDSLSPDPASLSEMLSSLTDLFQNMCAGEPWMGIEAAVKDVSALFSMVLPLCDEDMLQNTAEHCARSIGHASMKTTGYVHALTLIMKDTASVVPLVQQILPLDAIMQELRTYVEDRKMHFDTVPRAYEILPRMDLVLHGLAASEPNERVSAEREFWDLIAGDSAINNAHRALCVPGIFAKKQANISLQITLLRRCLDEFLPTLHPDHATRGLYCLQAYAGPLSTQVLEQFSRIALTATDSTTAVHFQRIVSRSLFEGEALKRPKEAIMSQKAVVWKCFQQLGDTGIAQMRVLELLRALVIESKKFEAKVFSKSSIIDKGQIVLSTNASPATDLIRLVIEATSPVGPLLKMTFRVSPLTTLAELKTNLIRDTGYSELRAFIGTRNIDFVTGAETTLADAGFADNLLIQVRKVSDQKSVLTDPSLSAGESSVETQVLERFDEIYGLLEASAEIAQRAYALLLCLHAPIKYKVLLAVEEVTESKLFPDEHPWKTQYSVFVMRIILAHQMQHGFRDEDSVASSLRLLIPLLSRFDGLDDLPLQTEIMVAMADLLKRKSFLVQICAPLCKNFTFICMTLETDTNTAGSASNERLNTYITDPSAFLNRVLRLIGAAGEAFAKSPSRSIAAHNFFQLSSASSASLVWALASCKNMESALTSDPAHKSSVRALLVNPCIAISSTLTSHLKEAYSNDNW